MALAAAARLATLDDADPSTDLLSDLGTWAWAAGIALIVADLVLPVPQASVITALGAIYGLALGTLLGTAGLILAGVCGYALMWTPLRRVSLRLLSGRSPKAIAALSNRAGPWGIALSRSLPYSVPEVIVCLAALGRMPLRTFLLSLSAGSFPAALLFAGIGAGWSRDPILALAISYALPILLLPLALLPMQRSGRAAGARPGS
ncbi:MAG TPA: VTT domain-containing protein [Acidimicrobiales bacterium]|nr:VTT domain-containing protein [Acidimicrobiales bacterium]